MSSKRNFKNLTPSILETYQELFLDDRDNLTEESELIFFNILNTKSNIMVNTTSYETFLKYLDNIIDGGDRLLWHIIDNFVEKNYSLNLDQITQETKDKKRKVNTQLQFSDAHAKDLLKIAYLYRVMIPIVSVYFYYNKAAFLTERYQTEESEECDEMEFDEVNTSIFAHLFNKFASNPEALRNKLYIIAESGVAKTSYSDKRFWLAAKNVAITEKTEALEIYKKLLTNAIPKLSIDGDKNVVSFLQSVINNQVDFLFQNKFKYHYVALGNNESNFSTDDNDDSSMSEFERIEIQQSRKNEGEYLLRKLNIEDMLERIPEKMGVGVDDAEVKDLMQYITKNPIQEQLIAILTFKYFDDKDALKYIDFYHYCYLVIACKKYLLQQKYIYIPKILTSECQKHRERCNISGKKIKPEILNSKKYKDLIHEKYPTFEEDAEKPFLSIIGTIYSSVFIDQDGNEIFDSSVKAGKIAEEIINLVGLI